MRPKFHIGYVVEFGTQRMTVSGYSKQAGEWYVQFVAEQDGRRWVSSVLCRTLEGQ